MTFESRNNVGSKGPILRLLFYFTAIFALCIIAVLALCSCSADTQDGEDSTLTITFVLNNGEADIVCDVGDSVPVPSRRGYYLYGWYADEDLSAKVEFDTLADILNSDNGSKFKDGEYKLFAKWKELKTMTGVRIVDTLLIYDGIPHLPKVSGLPDGASVEFLGDEEFKDAGEYDVVAVVRAYGYNDLTISGKLTISRAKADVSAIRFEDKTVEWDGSSKSIEISGSLPDGVTVSYENNGNINAGVYEIVAKFDCGKNYENIPDMTATLTIISPPHNVTFVEEDGTRKTVTFLQGQALYDIPVPNEKRGYVGRWSREDFENIHEDTTVYAVYQLIKYTIAYEVNGGVLARDSAVEYTVEDAVTLAVVSRDYCVFDGWFESADFDGESVSEIAKGSIGNRKYYAKWTAIEYFVEFELFGGVNDSANMNRGTKYFYTVSSEVLSLYSPMKDGYTFVRWYDENGDDVTVISATAPKSFTVYAEWTPVVYHINYELDGGENDGANPTDFTVESGVVILNNPTKNKFKFLGWYDNALFVGEPIEQIDCNNGKDVTLYAKWERIIFTVESVGGKNIITAYDYGFGANIVIESVIDGKQIDGIAAGVLQYAKSVELVGFEKINSDVFVGCDKLKVIKLPSTLKELPEGLLADCTALESLTVPYATDIKLGEQRIYSPLSMLFSKSEKADCYEVQVRTVELMSDGEHLNDFETDQRYIPNSLKEITVLGGDIPAYSLYGFSSVREIKILGDTSGIGVAAMGDCDALERVILPASIETVKVSAFNNCTNLKEIYLPKGKSDEILAEVLERLPNVKIVEYENIDDIPEL